MNMKSKIGAFAGIAMASAMYAYPNGSHRSKIEVNNDVDWSANAHEPNKKRRKKPKQFKLVKKKKNPNQYRKNESK